MAKLIYLVNSSLDGCVEDKAGDIEWGAADDEVFTFINDFERRIGTYLYGRRTYDFMVYWETGGTSGDAPQVARDFAEIWRAAEKIVYSRTLRTPPSARTRIERDFDPAAIRQLMESSARDITIGGPELAAQAMAAGLVDECHLLLHPIALGGGKRALPDDVRLRFELLEERRFRNGVVHLRYRPGA